MDQSLTAKLNDFIAKYDGKPVDVDKEYGPQCWDLVELFAEEVLEVPKEPWAIPLGPDLSAHEAWTYFEQSPHMQKYFTKIPAGQQQPADLMVYAGRPGYPEGHIVICVMGNIVFGQNADPDGSWSHKATRSSFYLLGALRRKGDDMDKVDEEKKQDLAQQIVSTGYRISLANGPGQDEPTPDQASYWVPALVEPDGLNNTLAAVLNFLKGLEKAGEQSRYRAKYYDRDLAAAKANNPNNYEEVPGPLYRLKKAQ